MQRNRVSSAPSECVDHSAQERLHNVAVTLNSIRQSPESHQCPGNSPAGHHDSEAFGEESILCKRFSLGCPHPNTDQSSDLLPAGILEDCLRELRAIGAVSEQYFFALSSRLNRTHRTLWDVDTARRKLIHFWANCHKRDKTSPEVMDADFPSFSRGLDAKFLPTQKEMVLERIAIIIEMQAAILEAIRRFGAESPKAA